MAESTNPHSTEKDPLQQMLGPSQVEEFVDKHKVQLLLGLVGLIALVSIAMVVQANAESRQIAEAQAFSSASSVSEFDAVANEYKGSVVGGNALIRKAALLEEDGKTEEAQTVLEGFLDTYPDHPQKGHVLTVLGRMAENREDWAKAQGYYSQIPEDSAFIGFAKIHEGDIMMQKGEYEAAKQHYQMILTEIPGDAWFTDLQNRIELAEKRAEFGPPSDPVPMAKPEEAKEETAEAAAPKPTEGDASTEAKPDAEGDGDKEKPAPTEAAETKSKSAPEESTEEKAPEEAPDSGDADSSEKENDSNS